ncbi:2-phosphosulfolactate phosphatase [Streptomyces sp. NBC_00536]|uniref:2-phosphosulfolactate phosphatase n=1 Tax=Streptomyces sp. NBC_00536 TaxID=2975769 RepID=UPI002E8096FF|nr:2-phosphosulfolactate phosphatase [Streptomyces sp. NBC_00536]WUC83292.1 2-phosphosulfolactate phosphatase [Streptomyces sp. NBC_00536]
MTDRPIRSDVLAPADFDPWPGRQVHLEWGVTGAALAAERGDAVAVVDVLSFSTTMSIACERDFSCLVYSGAEIADMGGPEAAGTLLRARPLSKKRRTGQGGVSLSPASILRADPGQRVLFTSLNGAAVVSAASAAPALVVAGPRNATAAAQLLGGLLDDGSARRVTVIACGEQWSSVSPGTGGVRPGVEDWLGAGLVCRELRARGLLLSAEARIAAAAWTSPADLRDCVSARELMAAGFTEDVELALTVDADSRVPVRESTDPTGRLFTGRSK